MPTQSGALLSRGVSIKGSVKFLNELLIDGEVEGTIDSLALSVGLISSLKPPRRGGRVSLPFQINEIDAKA